MTKKISQNANKKNLLQLIWLRLIAIFAQIITILFVNFILEIPLPLVWMFGIVFLIVVANFLSFCRYKSLSLRDKETRHASRATLWRSPSRMSKGHTDNFISDKSLFLEMLFDVLALTAQIYFSGGISNPFISLFLLQVVIGAILLPGIYAYFLMMITIGCYFWLSFNYQELHELHHHESGDSFGMHLRGMLISYIFVAVILSIFIAKIIKNLNAKNAEINLLNRKSIEREQVVRMGLLATSAAHEISTPLSTISVLVNDWKKMNLNQDLAEDISLIEAQLLRCKKVLSQILSGSNKERFEYAKPMPIKEAFGSLIKEWQSSRKPQNLVYNFIINDESQLTSDIENKPNQNLIGKSNFNRYGFRKTQNFEERVIFDETLIHAFFNIFDNALNASSSLIKVDATVERNEFIVDVYDDGKGFDSKILEQIGKLNLSDEAKFGYNSFDENKARLGVGSGVGSGVGLFLAFKSFERIGGKIIIKNMSQKHGAHVKITIPLKNLSN